MFTFSVRFEVVDVSLSETKPNVVLSQTSEELDENDVISSDDFYGFM